MIGIMPSNGLSQFNQPQSVSVTNATVLQGTFSGFSNDHRCRIRRLAYRHGNNRVPGCATTVCLSQNVHSVKGLDRTAAGKSDQLYLQKLASFAFYIRRIIAGLVKQQHFTRNYDQIPRWRLCLACLSMIECKGYKIRAGLKKEEQHDGDDDCTFPSWEIFFP